MELQEQFSHITTLISKAKENAFHAVNKELVTLYWHVGEYVSQQVEKKAWGKSVVNDLSLFIQQSEPNITGFSPQNIWRMKQFVETYKNFPKLATLSRELSWSQNRLILPLKSPEEQEFYLLFCIKEKWSVRELKRQINTSCFERIMLANEKLATLSGVFPKDKIVLNTKKNVMYMEFKTTIERLKFYRYRSGFMKIQALENMRPRWGQYQNHDSFSINIKPLWG
jgi:predicted nuclease of restriction endonuclease-like (RecB) superfamily